MKILIFLFTIFFSINTFAYSSSKDNISSQQENNTTEVTSFGLEPARVDVKGNWDVTINGSFIFWQPRVKDLEMVETGTDNSYEEINMNFKYKPGFKVGLGTNTNLDNWELFADYTWLHFSLNNSISQNLVKDFWTASTDLDYFRMKWKLGYDILTLNLSRSSYFGKNLILKPFAGLKGGWINTKIDALARNGNTQYPAKYESKSWLIGPRAGCNSKWILGSNIRFFSDTGIGIAYQDFKLDGNISNEAGTIIKAKEKIGYVSPNLDINLGFGWDKYFNNKSWYLDLSASYDFVYYFTQQTLRRLTTKEYASDIGALMLHGLTINTKIVF